MQIEKLAKIVDSFVQSNNHDDYTYAEISFYKLNEEAQYTNKKSYIFYIEYYWRGEDNTCAATKLVHVVKKKGGHQLMLCHPLNWHPTKDSCEAYGFLPAELIDKE